MTYEDAFIPFVTRHVIAVGVAIGMFFRANPTVWTEDAAGDRHHTAAARQHRGGGHRRDIARHHPALYCLTLIFVMIYGYEWAWCHRVED
jgi:hypothetical protein